MTPKGHRLQNAGLEFAEHVESLNSDNIAETNRVCPYLFI
jgi:hypothetical protein